MGNIYARFLSYTRERSIINAPRLAPPVTDRGVQSRLMRIEIVKIGHVAMMVGILDATMHVMDANDKLVCFFITLFNLDDVHFELKIGSIFTCLENCFY